MAQESPAACTSCGSPMLPKAVLCPVCKSYTSGWRNWLPHTSALAALITVALSLAAIAATFAVDLLEKWKWHDEVRVVDYASAGTMRLANLGSGAVLVTFVEVVSATGKPFSGRYILPIDRRLENGDILAIAVPHVRLSGPFPVRLLEEEQARIASDLESSSTADATARFQLHWFSVENATAQAILDEDKSIEPIEGRAVLHFLSAETGEPGTVEFKCHGIVLSTQGNGKYAIP